MSVVKKRLFLKGMHCVSCAMAIDFRLEDLQGVIKSTTNYAKQACEVEYDAEIISIQEIITIIQDMGYSVTEK